VWILATPGDPAAFSDSLDYLRFADTLRAAWSGDMPQDLRDFYAVTRFPPLYPLALFAVGAGLDAPIPAYWLSASLSLAGIVLALMWYRGLGLGVAAAAVLVLAQAINPALFLLALAPRSEALYLPLCVLSLWLAERSRAGRSDVLLFALVTSLLPLCRSAGMALCLAAAVWLWLVRVLSLRRRIAATLIVFAPALLWSWSRAGLPVQLDYVRDLSSSTLLDRLGGWHGALWERPLALIQVQAELLTGPFASKPAMVVALAMLALAALGALIRARARGLECLYALLYGGICLVWPYPAELPRLLAVLLPIVLLWVWVGTHALIQRFRSKHASGLTSSVVGIGLVIACLGFVIESWARASIAQRDDLAGFQRRIDFFANPRRDQALFGTQMAASVQQGLQSVSAFIEPRSCVYTIAPQMLWYHSGRRIDARALPFPWPGGAAQDALPACRYVLVTNTGSAQLRQPALYPLAELSEVAQVEFVVYADAAKTVPAAVLLRLPPRTVATRP
jgi:hypothetical protein